MKDSREHAHRENENHDGQIPGEIDEKRGEERLYKPGKINRAFPVQGLIQEFGKALIRKDFLDLSVEVV